MPAVREESRRHGAYKWLVDELVELARIDVTAKRIRMHGHPERTNDDDFPLDRKEVQRKAIFLSLSPEQRELLAEMFDHSLHSAIHDVACFLEWVLSVEELKMERNGEPITASPFETMHFDFVSRFAGDPWPDEGPLEQTLQ
jgi:hypothetical protein